MTHTARLIAIALASTHSLSESRDALAATLGLSLATVTRAGRELCARFGLCGGPAVLETSGARRPFFRLTTDGEGDVVHLLKEGRWELPILTGDQLDALDHAFARHGSFLTQAAQHSYRPVEIR